MKAFLIKIISYNFRTYGPRNSSSTLNSNESSTHKINAQTYPRSGSYLTNINKYGNIFEWENAK